MNSSKKRKKKPNTANKTMSSKEPAFLKKASSIAEKQTVNMKRAREHHLLLWLLLFFPYGIYLSFKHKLLPKWLNISFTVLVFIVAVACADTYFNPTRVIDNKTKKQLIQHENEIGTIWSIEFSKSVDSYCVYDVISSKGRYDVYLNEAYDIEAIKEIDPEIKTIYEADDFKYKGVYSEVLRYLESNTIHLSMNIKEIVKSDAVSQTLKIDDAVYVFYLEHEMVYKVTKEDGTELYVEKLPSIKMPSSLVKPILKKFPEIGEVYYVCNFYVHKDSFEFIFYSKSGKLYQVYQYESGKIVVNQAIDDTTNNSISFDLPGGKPAKNEMPATTPTSK